MLSGTLKLTLSPAFAHSDQNLHSNATLKIFPLHMIFLRFVMITSSDSAPSSQNICSVLKTRSSSRQLSAEALRLKNIRENKINSPNLFISIICKIFANFAIADED